MILAVFFLGFFFAVFSEHWPGVAFGLALMALGFWAYIQEFGDDDRDPYDELDN